MQTLKVIFAKQYNHTVTLYPKLKCHFAKIQQDCTTSTDLYTQIKLKPLDIIQQNVQPYTFFKVKFPFTLCVKKKYFLFCTHM